MKNRKFFHLSTIFLLALGFCVAATMPVSAQTTFSYTGAVVPIPDGSDLSGNTPGAPATAQITVSGLTGTVGDLNFRFDGTTCSATAGSTTVGLEHSFINDLRFTLTSPGGTTVAIVTNTDGGGNNFCQTVLDDEAVNPIQGVVTAQAPFTGTFTPANPLSAFDNQNPNGVWTLTVQDFFSQDTGNIRAFSLIITPQMTTAASVRVGGRVLRANGRGIANARVTVTGSSGETRTAITNPFGYYQFIDIPAGETYVLSVSAKRFQFTQSSQVHSTLEETSDINFVADN